MATPSTGNPVGAPTKMTDENKGRILAYLSMGRNFVNAASLVGMTVQTLGVWRRQDEEFSLACDQARANACTMPLIALVECMHNEPVNVGTEKKPKWRRPFERSEQMRACKWFLEHRSEEFQPKANLTIGAKTVQDDANDIYEMIVEMRGSVRGPDYPTIESANGHSNGNGLNITVEDTEE